MKVLENLKISRKWTQYDGRFVKHPPGCFGKNTVWAVQLTLQQQACGSSEGYLGIWTIYPF